MSAAYGRFRSTQQFCQVGNADDGALPHQLQNQVVPLPFQQLAYPSQDIPRGVGSDADVCRDYARI